MPQAQGPARGWGSGPWCGSQAFLLSREHVQLHAERGENCLVVLAKDMLNSAAGGRSLKRRDCVAVQQECGGCVKRGRGGGWCGLGLPLHWDPRVFSTFSGYIPPALDLRPGCIPTFPADCGRSSALRSSLVPRSSGGQFALKVRQLWLVAIGGCATRG